MHTCARALGIPCFECAALRAEPQQTAPAACDLRTKVALMRELGVTSWDGIVLGPPPPPPPRVLTDEERAKRDAARLEAERQDLFAASGYAPR